MASFAVQRTVGSTALCSRRVRVSRASAMVPVRAMASVTDAVKATIASAPVVVFSKTYCP